MAGTIGIGIVPCEVYQRRGNPPHPHGCPTPAPNHKQVADAIAACIDRTPNFVAEYLEAHFELDAQPELPAQPAETAAETKSAAADSPETAEADQETPETAQSDAPGEDQENVPPADNEGDADANDDAEPGSEADETEKEEPKAPPPPKPSLIEIYAKQHGFHFHAAEKCFTHPDGRWIKKSESPFNWEERAAGGELVSRMWVTDQKLANGVELAAELWTLLCQQPNSTTMVVVGEDHAPCALTGQELLELKDSRQITLHPARYRIVECH